ncbi:MAG: TolC family protein, partial [Burkholderiales bacterium]|nr:TolC family protein [Burkholderiales bacterium]
VRAAESELRRAKEEVTERLAEAYSDLLRIARTRASAAARLAQVVQLVTQVARQTEAGKLSELDLQQAQNAELDAELTSNTLESEYQSTLVRLRLLAGGELSEDLVEFSLDHTSPRDTTRNAALQVAQARATAAQLRVRTLAATLAPKIDLNVRQLLNNHTTPPQTTVQQRGWSIGVSWDMPLGGENFARRDESISRSAQAQSDVERAELAARAEFESLTPRIANLRHAVSNLTTQESKMAQLVRASNIQFEAGRRNLQQIIQSWDSYFNLQQRLHEQRHKLFLAQMRQLSLAGQLLESVGLAP